jgi:hypothetical protein
MHEKLAADNVTGLGKSEATWGSYRSTATRVVMRSCKRSFFTTLYTTNDSDAWFITLKSSHSGPVIKLLGHF